MSSRNSSGRDTPLRTDRPVYVIGDVHGRHDLLEQLMEMIETDRREQMAQTVFVGDLIDRGPDSQRVLHTVRNMTLAQDKYICLMGNHERMMLDFLADPISLGPRWIRNGGRETLASFGIDLDIEAIQTQTLVDSSRRLKTLIGAELLDWIAELPLFWKNETLVVVHAALDQNRRLDQQVVDTMLWGNSTLNRTPRTDGVWVAHGHTVVDPPYIGEGRISVDTGAYFTGRLTAAAIDPDGTVKFLTTR